MGPGTPEISVGPVHVPGLLELLASDAKWRPWSETSPPGVVMLSVSTSVREGIPSISISHCLIDPVALVPSKKSTRVGEADDGFVKVFTPSVMV